MKKRLIQNGMFFLINSIGFLILFFIRYGFHFSLRLPVVFFITSIIFVLIGSFLGLCIYLWRENETKKTGSYTIGLSIGSAGFFTLILFLFFFNKPDKKTNAENNRSDMRFGYKDRYEKEAWIAYNALVKKFANENDIRLNGGSSDYRDSMLDGFSQRFYIFRFKYFINSDSTLYVAKIMVHDTIPEIIYYNHWAATNAETIRSDRHTKKVVTEILDSVNMLLDSLKARQAAKQK